LLLSCLYVVWRTPVVDYNRNALLVRLLAPLALIIPWYLFKLTHQLSLGAEVVTRTFSFHADVLPNILFSFTQLDNFNVVVVFLCILLITGGKPVRDTVLLIFPLACFALFFILVYSFSSFYYEHFTMGTVFNRNVLVFYPSLCMIIALLIKKALSEKQPALVPAKRKRSKR